MKKAIITLRKTDSEIELLIPMHDAALFQVPKSSSFIKKEVIKTVFERAFAKECPKIKACAKFKSFAPNHSL